MKNDGGPAFPNVSGNARGFELAPGNISVRDYFAAAALQGLLANGGHNHTWEHARSLSNDALCIADSMLAEREKS